MAEKAGSIDISQLDEFELALGVAALAPPEASIIIANGLRRGQTAEQIDERLDRYRSRYGSNRAE